MDQDPIDPSELEIPEEPLPVSVLTGFLGSGKTTLLRHLIAHPDMDRTAVIINEFGEIGLDHILVESAEEDTILMSSGCLCCSVRGDLVETMRSLFKRRVKREVPPFQRLVIETTGLADPAPILQTLMSDPLLVTRFRLDGVIATVDAEAGGDTLDQHAEAVKQVAVADRLLLTKRDLVAAGPAEALITRDLDPGLVEHTARELRRGRGAGGRAAQRGLTLLGGARFLAVFRGKPGTECAGRPARNSG